MIRFCCEHCGRKISVQDKHAGNRGKCPECGTIVAIPAKSTVTTFHCQNCNRKINVPKTYAGKEAQCPSCKERLVIPAADFDVSPETPSLSAERKFSTGALTLLDVPKEYKLKDQPAGQPSEPEKAIVSEYEQEEDDSEEEAVGELELPWFIDIFLYPTSLSGLIHLLIFVGIPLLIDIVGTLLGPLRMGVGLPGFLLNVLIGLYLCWFITECVRDSAKGGTRAPEAFAMIDLGDMWSQALHIIGCYLILLGPVGFYHIFTEKTDVIFWLLLALAALFFPMGLLACIMFDSVHGLNPILLITSIFSTFAQYIGLVLLIVAIILVFIALPDLEPDETQSSPGQSPRPPGILTLVVGWIINGLTLYITFVIAHLIGHFYWRNQEKLNWEV